MLSELREVKFKIVSVRKGQEVFQKDCQAMPKYLDE